MNHTDAYKTLARASTGDYREKGSKFLSFAYPCSSENELKALLQRLKKQHPAARHFCYGAVIGIEQSEARSSDAGEPPGTAGAPILNQILSGELKNVAVIVVRYFGGTKLGKPGLIQAYRKSAQLAISQKNTITHLNTQSITVNYPYESTSEVMQRIERDPHLRIENQAFTTRCSITLAVPKSEVSNALSSFDNIPGVEVSCP